MSTRKVILMILVFGFVPSFVASVLVFRQALEITTGRGIGVIDSGLLKTRTIVIVDSKGNQRAMIDGSGLTLSDGETTRITLRVFKDDTGLTLFDTNGKSRVNLQANNAVTSMSVSSSNTEATAGLHILELKNTDPLSHLSFLDKNGKAA